jgi:hypothetical protein
MVTFPKDFVAIRYPGYFWNLVDKKLYSMKVSGVLRPLAGPRPANPFNHYCEGYQVSVDGYRRIIPMTYLRKLSAKNSVIPVQL